jgi:hypothetical protein
MRLGKFLGIMMIVFASNAYAQETPRVPMKAPDENSMKYSWAHKQVLESRLLDDCENPATWKYEGMKGEMSFTTERAKDGTHSVRLRAKTKGDGPAPGNRPWGSASVFRIVDNEDWTKWNRISMWIYPDLPGFKVVNAGIVFHNDGLRKVPGPGGAGRDYIILKNHQWNQVICEIEYCDRDKATSVEIQYRVQGNEPGATDTVQLDIDHIELQRVDADKVQGWDVAPGHIAFSHVGYQTGAPKTAIASNLDANKFELINKETGKVMVSKPLQLVTTLLGKYQIMDFSEIRKPGIYFIQAGNVKTREFRIGNDIWESTMLKSINFFYGMRCGYAVPGIHDVCHQDWIATQGDQKLQINGGWHDAGDLSQGLINTSDATYAMFSLAERLRIRKENPELAARAIEEAKWGLDWMAKTTLHNGKRVTWAVMDFWTDGIVGNSDDAKAGFSNSDYQFLTASSAEAIAYRVLKDEDPERAARSLKLAIEDWTFGLESLAKSPETRVRTELPACAVNASFELYKATGEQKYLDKALEIAPQIIDSQERNFLPGTNITGFFYGKPSKAEIMKYDFKGPRDNHLMMALSNLLEFFPENKDWMKWYSAVGLFSEYYVKNIVRYTEPFDMLPLGISNDTVGTKICDNFYLRKFPTRQGFGQLHLTLAFADAVGIASQARGNLDAAQLAERQIEWLTGMNPFSKSFVWGEGYDYHDYYNISGNIVGALPVGLPTNGKSDSPYWPPNALFAPTEVWVLPSLRLIHLLREVAGPSIVEGRAKTSVEFKDQKTGEVITVKPDASGNFSAIVPEGKYLVTVDGFVQNMTLLPCATYKLNSEMDFVVSSTTGKDGLVKIELTVSGKGSHDFSIRTDNLTLSESRKDVTIKAGSKQKLVWQGKVENLNSPWFAVVIPDNNLEQRKEANGAVITKL